MIVLADQLPSPVERFERFEGMPQRGGEDEGGAAAAALWVKRDDRVSAIYGGNKVRKLEHLLGAAREAGKRRILTVGAAGSHQVVALAIFGAELGFTVDAVLVPQPWSAHAERNLRVALAHGLRAHPVPAWSLAPLAVARHWSREAAFVPLGGSSVRGSLGFVAAARELASQVARGELPEPAEVVVAMGSGGTAAGLAAGFEQEGLRTRVVGVAISPPAIALSVAARRLAFATARALGASRRASARAARRIVVDARFLGGGYGVPTPEGERATEVAARGGLVLDPAYTSKSFAAALARAREGRGPVVFWHTLSTVPLPEREVALPEGLKRLFG